MMTVAPGYVVQTWTFGGTVPGPTIRVHLGDTVRIHLINQTAMSHSIDFHASQTAMNDQMVEIKPGATLDLHVHRRLRRRLDVPLRNGAGAACTSPTACSAWSSWSRRAAWRRSTRSSPSSRASGISVRRASRSTTRRRTPQRRHPTSRSSTASRTSTRTTPSRSTPASGSGSSSSTSVRTSATSFHIVGTIFDTVIKEGIVLDRGNAGGWGSQAVDLAPAQGAIVEFQTAEDGMYVMVDHAFNFVGTRSRRGPAVRRRRPERTRTRLERPLGGARILPRALAGPHRRAGRDESTRQSLALHGGHAIPCVSRAPDRTPWPCRRPSTADSDRLVMTGAIRGATRIAPG